MSARGFAVKDSGGTILVATISPTPQAAMVNWLIAVAGVMVTASVTPESITRTFDTAAARMGARVVPVRVEEEA